MQSSEGTGNIDLHSFFDVMDASMASRYLKEAGIPFGLQDRRVAPEVRGGVYDGPPVLLVLSVDPTDVQAVRSLLRSKMGLFPEREILEDAHQALFTFGY